MGPLLIYHAIFKHNGEHANPFLLTNVSNLSAFGYFTRRTIAEHLRFVSRTIVMQTAPGTRQTITFLNENNKGDDKDDIVTDFVGHASVRMDNLASVVIAHKDYPLRVAMAFLAAGMNDYDTKVKGVWTAVTKDLDQEPQYMSAALAKYQDPTQVDKLLKTQQQLDDVKDIMTQNINDILKRGETLVMLMEKSKDLSAASVVFYKKAKKTNQCCQAY